MTMPEGDELVVQVVGHPESVAVFENGATWTWCRDGENVYWISCRFKGIKAGTTYRIVTRMLSAHDMRTLRLENDLQCEKDADEFETFILESRLGYWRPFL